MRHARPLLMGLTGLAVLATAVPPAAAGIFGPKRRPEPEAVAAPPPPAAPPVAALPGPVLQAAGAYRAYVRKASALVAPSAGRQLESELETGETAEPIGLTRGAVAYAAVVAMQEPTFVEGVRAYANDPDQRRVIAQRLQADPAYATAFAGAAAAAARIASALTADGARLGDAGQAVRQSAYDMQKQSWSKGDIPDRPGRLARAKTLASTPMAATPEEMAALAGADAAAAPGQPRLINASASATAQGVPTSTIQHGLAIAALAALGETGDANDAVVQTLLNDATGAFCHNMAKLNLYQCLAVAKPYYEDAFCLGQHVLIDTGQCVMKVAGAPAPATVAEVAVPTPAAPTKPLRHRR